jgi:hypothetical protein
MEFNVGDPEKLTLISTCSPLALIPLDDTGEFAV